MGRSRRKYQRSRTKVKVGLPKKHPNMFKPTFTLPPKLQSLMEESTHSQWDAEASVILSSGHSWKRALTLNSASFRILTCSTSALTTLKSSRMNLFNCLTVTLTSRTLISILEVILKKMIYIWNRKNSEPIEVLSGHSMIVNCVSRNPRRHKLLASASDDQTIRIWGSKPSKNRSRE